MELQNNYCKFAEKLNMSDISIIVPVFKVEKYIERCVRSILIQEVEGVNIECIFVDDCSPDKSILIIQDILKEYTGSIKCIIIKHEINRGLSAARNTGLKAAHGDYVIFADSDDYFEPNSIEYLYNITKLYPDVDLIIGNAFECKSQKTQIDQRMQSPTLLTCGKQIRQDMLRLTIYHNAWNKLVSRQLLLDDHILFEEGILFEDILWTFLLFAKIEKAILAPKVSYIYENNATSIMNTTSQRADYAIHSYVVTCNKILDAPYEDLQVDQEIYVLNVLMLAIDIAMQNEASPQVKKELSHSKKRLLQNSIKNGHVVLALFLLVMYPPIKYLLKIHLFRRNFNNILNIIRKISIS